MTKRLTIAIILSLAGLIFFGRARFLNPIYSEDPQAAALRERILFEPKINGAISAEERAQDVDRFQILKQKLRGEKFENLKDLDELAQIKKSVGDFEGAAEIWTFAGLIRPTNSFSFANLGLLYHEDLKKYDLAEKNYLRALANDPDDIETIRNLFDLYFKALNDRPKAEALLQKSIESHPQSADLYLVGGSFYLGLGEKEKALEFYRKYIELNPNNGAVQKEIDRLKSELGQ